MDKNSYETYEFLPDNNTETESDQFFLVQDDGTLLFNRPVQCVTQVQDVKGVLEGVQPCTVYDVSSQQFFVDNSSELISVPDQFILPVEKSEICPDSYLLQAVSSTTDEQMDVDVVDSFKNQNSEVDESVTQVDNQANYLTEITLTDEQCHMLEHNGWILLETNEKVFVLDMLGLRDITTDDKLIQQLKREIQTNTNLNKQSGCLQIEKSSSNTDNSVTQNLSSQQFSKQVVTRRDVTSSNEKNIQSLPVLVNKKLVKNILETHEEIDAKQSLTLEGKYTCKTDATLNILQGHVAKNDKLHSKEKNGIVRLKTNYNSKDIPDKIVLGKSLKGKNIVAKIIKPETGRNESNNNSQTENDINIKNKIDLDKYAASTVQMNNVGLQECLLRNIIEQSLRDGSDTVYNVEDLVAANTTVTNLLQAPKLNNDPAIFLLDLLITRVIRNEEKSGKISESTPSLVTGRINSSKNGTKSFIHVPDLIQNKIIVNKIKSDIQTDSKTPMENKSSCQVETFSNENYDFLHLHTLEMRQHGKVVRLSTTVINRRSLPLSFVNNTKKPLPSTLFACSGCAVVFQNEKELKQHKEAGCSETCSELIIDNDAQIEAYPTGICYTLLTTNNKQKGYYCMQCNKKYVSFDSCQRHLKTHASPNLQETSDNKECIGQASEIKEKVKGIYKCNMCPSSYYYSSSLSKHIVKRHIKVKCI